MDYTIRLVRFYDEFGVYDAKFIPYWRNNKYVKILKGKNIYGISI